MRWFKRCAALRSDVSEARFLPGPRRADVLETGDFGGDKLGGLTRYVEKPRRADVHLGGLARQTLAGSGAVPRRADVLVTSAVTSSAGWNSQVFRVKYGFRSTANTWSSLSEENERIWRPRQHF